jgi:hypothetical protein
MQNKFGGKLCNSVVVLWKNADWELEYLSASLSQKKRIFSNCGAIGLPDRFFSFFLHI